MREDFFSSEDIQPNKGALLHKCSVCKRKFYWNCESKWFAKRNNQKGLQDEGFKICSTFCLNNSKHKGK